MIIPNSGRVAIIDDQRDDVSSLFEALSKEGISFIYFSGLLESLPPKPIDGISYMFLDLELDGTATSDKTRASHDIHVILKILGENAKNGTVIIITWSQALGILEELEPMMEANGIIPLALLKIAKSECKENGLFNIEKIKEQINEKLTSIPSIELLEFWDNLVQQASNDVYRKIISLDMKLRFDILNKHINSIYYELAKASLGKDNVTKESSYAVLNVLNMILANRISNMPHNNDSCIKLNIIDKIELNTNILAEMNSIISFNFPPYSHIPGNIYENEDEKEYNKVFMSDIFGSKRESDIEEDDELYYTHIYCEISTLCDCAQNRDKQRRFIPGLAVSEELRKTIKKADAIYITESKFKTSNFFNDNIFYLVFDLRMLFTVKIEDFTDKEPVFQLNDSLLMHIQNRMGRNISNPGILSLRQK